LCELWQKDKINGKSVYCTYIDEKTNPFTNVVFPFRENEISIKLKGKCNEDDYPHVPWSWIENHTKLCEYSLDIRKCNNKECCGEWRATSARDFLSVNNGFLPAIVKALDGHYLNPIHVLEFLNGERLPEYDAHCPSISSEIHQRKKCMTCGKYFPTLNFLTLHYKSEHPRKRKSKSNTMGLISNSSTIDYSEFPSLQERLVNNITSDYFSDIEH
jgi:hypothetical protein